MTHTAPAPFTRCRRPRLWDSLASQLIIAVGMLVIFIGAMGAIAVWRADSAAQANAEAHGKY